MEQGNADHGQSNPEFLVSKIKNGDKEAFMKLVGLYQQKIFVLAIQWSRREKMPLIWSRKRF